MPLSFCDDKHATSLVVGPPVAEFDYGNYTLTLKDDI